MRTPTIPNLSLIPAVVGALLQAGAQLFAIAVVVGTVTEAPPRSLAMYAGEYGYNSGPFWEVMPTVTLGLLLIALVGNWRTPRRRLLLAATPVESSRTVSISSSPSPRSRSMWTKVPERKWTRWCCSVK